MPKKKKYKIKYIPLAVTAPAPDFKFRTEIRDGKEVRIPILDGLKAVVHK